MLRLILKQEKVIIMHTSSFSKKQYDILHNGVLHLKEYLHEFYGVTFIINKTHEYSPSIFDYLNMHQIN